MPDNTIYTLWNTSQPTEANWPSRSAQRNAADLAGRLTRAACHERRVEAVALMDQGVRFFTACRDAGMPSDYINDAARGFHDKMSDVAHGIDRDLDEAGLIPAEALSFAELDAIIGRTGR